MMTHRRMFTMVLLLSAFVMPNSTNAAITVWGIDYFMTAASENVIAPFYSPTSAPSGVTINTYTGLVLVTVSGTGQSAATDFNDAFYVFADGAGNPKGPDHISDYYQLAFDTSPILGAPGNPTPTFQLAKNALVYDVDAGVQVSAGSVPAYRSDHTYSLILDTGIAQGGTASQLFFGVSNGIYSDNTGHYSINVTDLSTVPEPGTLTLIGLGLVGAAAARSRRRRTR